MRIISAIVADYENCALSAVTTIAGKEVFFLVWPSCNGRGLQALQEEGMLKRFYLVSQDPVEMVKGSIQRVHWQTFLTRLWAGTL